MKAVLRRSSRLLAQAQKRQGAAGTKEESVPSVKRPCKDSAIPMLRTGSPENDTTQVASGGAAPSVAAAAAASSSCCAACKVPSLDSFDSDASQQTPVEVAGLQRAVSCSPVDGPASAAAAPASPAVPASAAASAQKAQQEPPHQSQPHPSLPAAYLSELEAANERVQRLPLPGGLPFYPVHSSCQLLPIFCMYGVSPAAVVLGASYLQRLLLKRANLRQEADQAGFFSLVHRAQGGQAELVMHARPTDDSLLAAYCVCVYLGIKVTDGVQFSNQLTHMLTNILGGRVAHDDAVRLEMQVLQVLDWRLGPYCCKPHHLGPW